MGRQGSRDSSEFRESRDSRESSSEKTPLVMTPFSGPNQLEGCEFGCVWASKFVWVRISLLEAHDHDLMEQKSPPRLQICMLSQVRDCSWSGLAIPLAWQRAHFGPRAKMEKNEPKNGTWIPRKNRGKIAELAATHESANFLQFFPYFFREVQILFFG